MLVKAQKVVRVSFDFPEEQLREILTKLKTAKGYYTDSECFREVFRHYHKQEVQNG